MKINRVRGGVLLTVLLLIATQIDAKAISVYCSNKIKKIKAKREQHTHQKYIVQMGAFKNEQNATQYKEELSQKTLEPVAVKHEPDEAVPYKVQVGPIASESKAYETCEKLSDNKSMPSAITALPKETSKVAKAVIEAPQTVFETKTTAQPPKIQRQTRTNLPNHRANYDLDASRTPFFTVSVGPAWSEPGKTQNAAFLPGGNEARYVKTNGSSTIAVGELFFGYESPLVSDYRGQLGIAFLGATNVSLTGDVWTNATPSTNNFFYTYSINHLQFALKGKIISERDMKALYAFHPYISGSIGVGFNQSYKFALHNRQLGQTAPQPFADNTTTAFTYTAGAGLQRRINSNWIFGIGYDFNDWGKSYLSSANTQNPGVRALALNHVYVNELQFGFTYKPQSTK